MWEGEISVRKVLVKNDYFLYPKFELHRYLHWCSFYGKKYGACIVMSLLLG